MYLSFVNECDLIFCKILTACSSLILDRFPFIFKKQKSRSDENLRLQWQMQS